MASAPETPDDVDVFSFRRPFDPLSDEEGPLRLISDNPDPSHDVGERLSASNGAIAVLNLFSGGGLSRVSVFSLGIMPYITAQIIMQMMQAVIPSLAEMAKEGEAGQRKITQYTRYVTIALALINAIGYLFLFRAQGINFSQMQGVSEMLESVIVVLVLLTGAILIM